MKNDLHLLLRSFLPIILIALFAISCDSVTSNDDEETFPELLTLLSEDSEFSAFNSLLKETGVIDRLDPDSSYTILVPQNTLLESASVSELDNDALSEILSYHIVPSSRRLIQLSTTDRIPTLAEEEIRLSQGLGNTQITFNNKATIVSNRIDIEAENGFIHQINNVLLTDQLGTLSQNLIKRTELNNFREELVDAGILDDLENEDGEFTLFAPVNDGFNNFFGILLRLTDDELKQVFLNHIVEGRIESSDLPLSGLESLAGEEIKNLTIDDRFLLEFSINSIDIDISGVNGVIHTIDSILLTKEIRERFDL